MSIVEKAIKFATERHYGQVDKIGEPYILHPLRVMADVRRTLLIRGFGSISLWMTHLMAAAVLHDVVEDTPTTLEEIRDEFGSDVCRLVDLLSRREKETYKESIDRVAVSGTATIIKLADLRDNTDPRRITRESGMYARYAKATYRLKNGEWP